MRLSIIRENLLLASRWSPLRKLGSILLYQISRIRLCLVRLTPKYRRSLFHSCWDNSHFLLSGFVSLTVSKLNVFLKNSVDKKLNPKVDSHVRVCWSIHKLWTIKNLWRIEIKWWDYKQQVDLLKVYTLFDSMCRSFQFQLFKVILFA